MESLWRFYEETRIRPMLRGFMAGGFWFGVTETVGGDNVRIRYTLK